jgi:hypothetical protein
LTVPKTARFRRERPKGVVLHSGELGEGDIQTIEALPVTTIPKTISDLVEAGARTDLVGQAISDAKREGFIEEREARRLKRFVDSSDRTQASRRP